MPNDDEWATIQARPIGLSEYLAKKATREEAARKAAEAEYARWLESPEYEAYRKKLRAQILVAQILHKPRHP